MPLTREQLVLAVLSTSNGESWNPTQLLKFFFILDKKVTEDTGGPHWNFLPFDYGPFDPTVFRVLEDLHAQGLALSHREGGFVRTYRLTVRGHRQGEKELKNLPERARDYIRRLSEWMRPLSFTQLVSAIYRDFPEMITWKPLCLRPC